MMLELLTPGIRREKGAALGRTPEIVADAAAYILTQDSRTTTGNFFIDEEVLVETGVTDFSGYAVCPGMPLKTDLFLD
jgi:citronellol/citronellal dehydrogenase